LRVEKAKENYLARLHREWTAKPDVEDEEMAESDVAQDQSMQTEPLRIPTPASGFVKRKVCDQNPHFAILTKGSLGPIWDHLKLLYIERLTASSFLAILTYPKHQKLTSSKGTWPNACVVYKLLRQNCRQVHDVSCHSTGC